MGAPPDRVNAGISHSGFDAIGGEMGFGDKLVDEISFSKVRKLSGPYRDCISRIRSSNPQLRDQAQTHLTKSGSSFSGSILFASESIKEI